MSRSGYSDELENWQMIKWRGQVASAIRGRRGQRLLTELLAALDAMPEKALAAEELETPEGEVCALGCLGKARRIDMATIDPEDYDQVAAVFDVAPQLAQEIVWENDEAWGRDEDPEDRWRRMRKWVASKIHPPADAQ